MRMLKFKTLTLLGLSTLLLPGAGFATPLLFTGSTGSLSASVSFNLVGGDLLATLTNTSAADVQNPGEVLTAVFFDLAGNPALSRVSAVLGPGSTVFFGPGNGGVVGGEWAYATGLAGAPGGATQGISSAGLNWFGPHDLFPGPNLQGPASPGGVEYGLTSAGDNLSTGNAAVTGKFALIQDSVVFTLGNVPGGFKLSDISNVSFFYGTGVPGPTFQGRSGGPNEAATPEPASLLLIGGGLLLVAGLRATKLGRRTDGQA